MKKCEKRVLTITGLMMLSIFLLLPLNSWAGNPNPPGSNNGVGPTIKGTVYFAQSACGVHVTFQGKCKGEFITWESDVPTDLGAFAEDSLPNFTIYSVDLTSLGKCTPKNLTPSGLIVDKVKNYDHSSPNFITADVDLLFLAY
jgi:hypothetical protein